MSINDGLKQAKFTNQYNIAFQFLSNNILSFYFGKDGWCYNDKCPELKFDDESMV